MVEKLISLTNIAYQYPGSSWRLDASAFAVAAGEILAILGANGSGKSTLLKLTAGALKPLNGSVCLKGRNIKDMGRRQIAQSLGYLPQQTESHFDYSVEEVVAMGRFARLKGLGFLGRRDVEVVTRSMEQTETDCFRKRPLSQLSGGERQRVLLASVLAQEPQILLLDEPTSALDIHHQMRFFSILSELVNQGMAVVIVTHDLNLASVCSGRILLLKDGRVFHEGSPDEVLTEDILQAVYGEGLELISHPSLGCPMVLPALIRKRQKPR